jgi:hypothetical protein
VFADAARTETVEPESADDSAESLRLRSFLEDVAVVAQSADPQEPEQTLRVSPRELKAAAILKTLQHVYWYEHLEELRLCTYGEIDVLPYLREAAGQGTVLAKPINLEHLEISSDIERCNILLISEHEQWREIALDTMLYQPGLVTISDTEEFLCLGGMISIALSAGGVRLMINNDAVAVNLVELDPILFQLSQPWRCDR